MTTNEKPAPLEYKVGTIRAAGLEAKWGKSHRGAPFLFARKANDPKAKWFVIDRPMWDRANEVGIAQAFDEFTVLADIFSIRA